MINDLILIWFDFCGVKACMNIQQFDFRICLCIDGHLGHVGEREKDSSACQGSVMEEKWLIKELLLLQYHVAPLQSHPVRGIYHAGSSLPGVLGSRSRESQPHVKSSIAHLPRCLQGGSARLTGSCKMFQCCGDDLWILLRY